MDAPVMVETITIPLRAEKVSPNHSDGESTGFPFDESNFGERDRSFRSHIDDIVNRHPELAEHLNFDRNFDRFPFRSNNWGQRRRGSGSSGEASSEYPENRRFGRPFGSRFEECFGFPFNSTFDGEPEYYKQEKTQPQNPPQAPTQEQQPQKEERSNEEKPPQVPNIERSRKQNPNIPQSSTVDLGQKQEPVHDTRGQRSMSAPPENRAGQQRFVSSINIPMQNPADAPSEQSAPQQQPPPPKQQPQQQQQPPPPKQQSQQNRSNERVIPIHVEGRDEPVVPKPGTQTFNQPPPQAERVYPSQQSERVFGQRPSAFGTWERNKPPYYTGEQYFPRDQQFYQEEPQYFDGNSQFFNNKSEPPQQQQQQRPNQEEHFTGPFRQQQQQQPHPQQYQKPQQQQPTPSQQQTPQPAPPPSQQQQSQQPEQPAPQPPPKSGAIDQINCIEKDVLQLMDKVEKFNGKPRDKEYVYLDEMLTRNLLKLDDVETEGKENIRLARKEAINCIQKCISILEAKAAANEHLRSQLMEVDNKSENPAETNPITTLEVSGISRSGSQVNEKVDDGGAVMDIVPSASAENVPASSGNMEGVDNRVETQAVLVQPNEENLGDGKTLSSSGDANVESSQTLDVTKDEVNDKKEKKKVKKKEKSDKAEK